jgi:transposase
MGKKCPGFKGRIKFACSDMWVAYLKVIREEIPNTMHVLDCFLLLMKHVG